MPFDGCYFPDGDPEPLPLEMTMQQVVWYLFKEVVYVLVAMIIVMVVSSI